MALIQDFSGRVRRTIICQSKHCFGRILDRLSPQTFHSHPKLISSLWYASQIGYFPNLRKPKDFHSQLIAVNLKAYRDEAGRKLRIRCADKYEVREYVKERGLESLLNDCYGVFNDISEVDFDSLPDQFVIKMTNGCGQNYICRDKRMMNVKQVCNMFHTWMAQSDTFGLKTGEWHYSQIKPRIIVEKYLSSLGEDKSIIDYKFHCIHGKIAGILVCYDRDNSVHDLNLDFYDSDWNLTEGILPQFHKDRREIPKPFSYPEMFHAVETLCEGIDYVRVDMYEIDGKPLFGEMTFTPAGNIMLKYSPDTLDQMLDAFKSETNA